MNVSSRVSVPASSSASAEAAMGEPDMTNIADSQPSPRADASESVKVESPSVGASALAPVFIVERPIRNSQSAPTTSSTTRAMRA